MNNRFSDSDRRILRDALCAIPQFQTVRERQTFIRDATAGHPSSDNLERVLQYLDWQGAPLVVADDLIRLVEGHEIAPGLPAIRVLAEAIEPMAGMARREQVRSVRERLGWVAQPSQPPAAAPALSPDHAALAARREEGKYDVFLCHNSKDKPAVMRIGDRLLQRGLLPWLDQDCLRPGFRWLPALERQIDSIPAAAVFIGASGIGPWQDEETDAILRRFKRQNRPVIPVMLEDAPESELPPFLDGRMRVDFRKNSPDPMDQLVYGITGNHPRVSTTS